MVVIRLSRRGSTKRPFYGVMVADSRKPRDGRFIEQVGTYDPRSKTAAINLRLDRVDHWKSNGAQLSETVAGLVKRFKALQPAA